MAMDNKPASDLKDNRYAIFTDIVKRNKIRKVDQLERVVKYTFDNVGQTFSANTLSKYIKSQER
mgnify:CR=1 FL=1